MSDVPHLDLVRQHAALREEILAAVASIVDTTAFVGGARVTAFEEAFAAFCGTPHAVGLANGTDAIKLALKAAGVGSGDEVIVPAYTFVATAGAVLDLGAVPVLADVETATALLSPEDAARRATEKTRAIVVVHLYGVPAEPAAFRKALAARGLDAGRVAVIEDCAQAHGASLRGARVGSLGDAAAFSFYPTKNLGAMGDGGAVTTSRRELADAVRMISDHGRPLDPRRRGEHLIPGVNSRLDTLQAAVLSIKLRHLAAWNEQRGRIAARYRELLSGREDVALQALPDGAVSSWYLFALRHPRRDMLQQALAAEGVQARVMYPCALHELPALDALGHRPGDFPAAEAWGREVLTLPMFPELRDDEVERVLAALPKALDASR